MDDETAVATEIRGWVADFGAEVAERRFDDARRRIAPGVVAFGTHADIVLGPDRLEAEQWRRIWPNIEDFAFVMDEAVVIASPDCCQAVAVVPWSSTGFDETGAPFDRPGRATIVIARAAADQAWSCVHTHFSLGRDVPSRTHGRGGDRT